MFFKTTWLTKIVLPKVLRNFKFHLLAQGTEPKSFPHNIQCRTSPPFQFFFGIARHFFFRKKNFPKGSPFNFFWVLGQTGYRKIPKGPPFQFFLALWDFSKKNFIAVEEITLKFWCPFAIFEPWIWRRLVYNIRDLYNIRDDIFLANVVLADKRPRRNFSAYSLVFRIGGNCKRMSKLRISSALKFFSNSC